MLDFDFSFLVMLIKHRLLMMLMDSKTSALCRAHSVLQLVSLHKGHPDAWKFQRSALRPLAPRECLCTTGAMKHLPGYERPVRRTVVASVARVPADQPESGFQTLDSRVRCLKKSKVPRTRALWRMLSAETRSSDRTSDLYQWNWLLFP